MLPQNPNEEQHPPWMELRQVNWPPQEPAESCVRPGIGGTAGGLLAGGGVPGAGGGVPGAPLPGPAGGRGAEPEPPPGGGTRGGAEPLPPFGPSDPQLPVGGSLFSLTFVTSGPGSGKSRSTVSRLVHPFPVLARKMFGRLLNGIDADPPPPVMVTVAQFMYISRTPTLLNQVQAKI